MNQETRGGARQGAGRKALTAEQIEMNNAKRRQILLDELLFPAVCSAIHNDPGVWKDGYLTCELSKTDIKRAYGAEGLKEWCSYFTQKKRGGKDRFGNGYKTSWTFNLNKYSFFVKLVESLGHTIKDLPRPGFPPDAMVARLKAIEDKAAKKRIAKVQAACVN